MASKLVYRIEQLAPSFRSGDVDDIIGLYQQLNPGKETSRETIVDHLVQQTRSQRDAVIVARLKASTIVGMAGVHILTRGQDTEARLEDVVVDEPHRGFGIATGVVKASIDWARQLGADHMELTSAPEQVEANHLYERMGFVLRETNVRRFDIQP